MHAAGIQDDRHAQGSARTFVLAAFALVLGIGNVASCQVAGRGISASVWVNSRSGVYHCPNTEFFGRTKRGEYMTEVAAVSAGYRPAHGVACSAGDTTGRSPRRGVTSSGKVASAGTPCRLVAVIDGDTIECHELGRVRLIGIDAPERSQRPYGESATEAMRSLLRNASTLRLEFDVERRDRYGRLLSYVWNGSHMINRELVRGGWALAKSYPPNTRYDRELAQSADEARRGERGLWPLGGFTCHPAGRRRGLC